MNLKKRSYRIICDCRIIQVKKEIAFLHKINNQQFRIISKKN